MAGTNNVSVRLPAGNDAELATGIAQGVEAIIQRCKKQAPEATIVLMGITPRNDNMAFMPVIGRVNARLAQLANGHKLRFVNINDRLADAQGRLLDGMTDPDLLHLAPQGYAVWADALRPVLTELLGAPAATDSAPPPTGDPSAVSPERQR